jgi:hypothetical protein
MDADKVKSGPEGIVSTTTSQLRGGGGGERYFLGINGRRITTTEVMALALFIPCVTEKRGLG